VVLYYKVADFEGQPAFLNEWAIAAGDAGIEVFCWAGSG